MSCVWVGAAQINTEAATAIETAQTSAAEAVAALERAAEDKLTELRTKHREAASQVRRSLCRRHGSRCQPPAPV